MAGLNNAPLGSSACSLGALLMESKMRQKKASYEISSPVIQGTYSKTFLISKKVITVSHPPQVFKPVESTSEIILPFI